MTLPTYSLISHDLLSDCFAPASGHFWGESLYDAMVEVVRQDVGVERGAEAVGKCGFAHTFPISVSGQGIPDGH